MALIRQTNNFIWNTKDVLGHGATGNVYKARHKGTGDMHAVKTFNAASFDRPGNVQMREFEILSRLDHKNIVKMLTVEVDISLKDRVIVMELCSGGSLYSILNEQPQNAFGLPEQEFLAVLGDVTTGVEYLRGEKIAHRDIKPGNILRYITEDGRSVYKLTDFGAARELQDGEEFVSLYGTEEYLHPDIYEKAVLKQFKGQSFTAAVDLWSLGVTFYHVATGHLPFRPYGGRANKEIMYKMIGEKQSGVISGIQSERGGPIRWSRQLPNTCIQSQGLQDLVTPMFAALLETDQEKQWTFNQFFDYVSSLTERRVIHVFSVPQALCMRVYIPRQDSYAAFQELIAQQTDIPACQQLLLFNNDSLENIVMATQPVDQYPTTTPENPVFLLPKSYHEFCKLPNHIVPSLPRVNMNINNNEHDSVIAKVLCEVLYLAQHEMSVYLKKERHLKAAVQMLINYYTTNIKNLCSHLKELKTRQRVQTQQLSTLQTCHGRETALLHLVNKQFTDLPEDVVISEFQLDEMVEASTETAEEVKKLLQQTEVMVGECNETYVLKKGLCKKWNNKEGVTEGDNSSLVINELVKTVHKTHDDFKMDAMRGLSTNDDQVHRFEKQKVDHRCKKGMKLFLNVFTKLKDVYNQLPSWFNEICTFQEKYKKVEDLMRMLTETVDAFSEKLDMTAKQYSETMAKILERLNRESVNHPVIRESIDGTSSLDSIPHSQTSSSAPNSWTISADLDEVKFPPPAEGDDSQRSQKVQELCKSLKSINDSSAEVKHAIDENKKLIEGLKLLKMKTSGDSS